MSVRRGAGVLCALAAAVAVAGVVHAARPPEALDAERHDQAVELGYLIRKTDALSASLVERRTHLRKRLRAMYKMSQGGYLRLLLGADSPRDLFERRDAANRILHRDVDELAAVQKELQELFGLREKLREGERRARALSDEARQVEPTGLSRKDALGSPIPGGHIVGHFGAYHDGAGLEFTNDGVDISCRAGEAVYAPAAGAVRAVDEAPGLGLSVVIDHGDGWMSMVSGLASPRVRLGARVPAGFEIGEAAATGIVHFQLSQGGAWLDPEPWLARK